MDDKLEISGDDIKNVLHESIDDVDMGTKSVPPPSVLDADNDAKGVDLDVSISKMDMKA